MASGDTLFYVDALSNQPPDADYATIDFVLVASADEPDDMVPVLDFDPGATNEHAEFGIFLPRHYGGGGVTLSIGMMTTSTGGEVVRVEAAWKSFTPATDVLDSKAYAAVQSANKTMSATARVINVQEIAFTSGAQMDSAAAGEYVRIRLTRDSADAADTMNSFDMEFVFMEGRET